jgi:glycosyltransferase involved in cell wall biosynthesis
MAKIICTVTNDLNFDQRMIRVCPALSEAGHEVVLVGRKLQHSPPLQSQSFAQHRFHLFFNAGKLFYFEYNLRLFFYLLFCRFDVVNSVDLDTLLPGFLAARLKRKICVYDAHEYFTEVPEVVRRPVVQRAWEWLARQLVPRVWHAYTVCDSLARVFHEKYGTSFEVIRNVPAQKRHPPVLHKKNAGPFILLYQGALNEGRGLEESIRAMAQLEGCELWLAGEGDLSAGLWQLAAELNLTSKVKFTGRLTPAALAALTPQAHLGLNLLRNQGLNYYYSLANKAFDYIQAGLPSLNMAFPEYRHLHEQYGVFYLLDELNVPAIVHAVEELKNNGELYQNLADHCVKAAKILNWENEKPKLLAFYERVLSPI